MPRLLLLAALLVAALPARGQGSVVRPGAGGALTVDGAPYLPLGWTTLGTCPAAGVLSANARASVAADLAELRRHGVNTILEPEAADGRIVARAAHRGWYNWYGYGGFRGDAARRDGHPRPGAFVEGMRWLLQEGMRDPARPVRVLVSVGGFVRPGYSRADGLPYGGDDVLPCEAYRAFIEQERAANVETDPALAARIPAVDCGGQSGRRMPFWEWNLWYVVQSLRAHPGLLGWSLWDEPEGITWRHLFGIVTPDRPMPAYTGPASLPTPDLLHYAYERVKAFEAERAPAGYARHPVVVDINEPNVFFGRRFGWSSDGALDPAYSSGPFDRRPGGGHGVPADVLGVEASSTIVHPDAVGGQPPHAWYWDANFVTRRSDALTEVARGDARVWGVMTVAGQAQLPSAGPFAPAAPLRCGPNDQQVTRLLNDRDLVWQLVAPAALGVRGLLLYSHALLPTRGPGAAMADRANHLFAQFRAAGLDDVLLAPARPVRAGRVHVRALTNYFRRAPAFTGPADGFDPGRSAFDRTLSVPADAYTVRRFGRAADERHYAHAQADAYPTHFAGHRLLQAALHAHGGARYLFVANAYDARIEAELLLDAPAGRLREAAFDLDHPDGFVWRAPTRLRADGARLAITLEPYEARVLRLD